MDEIKEKKKKMTMYYSNTCDLHIGTDYLDSSCQQERMGSTR